MRGWTWSSGAASWQSGVACSTCSRRPRSIRSGWSSGVTRSRTSATSGLLTRSVRDRARQLAAEWPGLHDILGKMAEGITVEGMEALAPALTDSMELLLDYLPAGSKIIACDPERIRARAADLVATSQEFLEASWVAAAAGGQVPIDLGPSAIRP